MDRKATFPALLWLLFLSGCGQRLPDSASVLMPQIQSLTATDITARGATLIASVSHENLLVGYGFTVGETDAATSRNINATLDGNLITLTLDDLKETSDYTFQAYIDNGNGMRNYSEAKSFTTLSVPPGPDNPGGPEDPGTPLQPESGYVEIPDGQFREWILWNYDADRDGRLSSTEAGSIQTIELGTDNIRSLSGIEFFPALTKLHAEGTRTGDTGSGQLTALDLSGNPKLQHLYVPHNRITSLDLSPVPLLDHCDVCMNGLKALDVSMLKAITLMNISRNPIERLDVRGLDTLDELHCDMTAIRELLLDNKVLRYIDCHGTAVETLDFSRCLKLNTVDCLDCTSLKTIYLAKGQVLGTLRKDSNVKIVYKDE